MSMLKIIKNVEVIEILVNLLSVTNCMYATNIKSYKNSQKQCIFAKSKMYETEFNSLVFICFTCQSSFHCYN